jgi:hypothetical protein
VWMTWFIGCLPQAIIGMVFVPLLLFKQYPPEVRVSLCLVRVTVCATVSVCVSVSVCTSSDPTLLKKLP